MDRDEFEGKWKEMRGQVKGWWGRLREDELDKTRGNAVQLIGLLQQKYGYTKVRAENEFNRRLKEVEAHP